MQMKKPKKFCKNPECEQEILEYKSLKREYCSDYCRSHYGYARRLEENKEFIAHAKGLSENYKLLKMHKQLTIVKFIEASKSLRSLLHWDPYKDLHL